MTTKTIATATKSAATKAKGMALVMKSSMTAAQLDKAITLVCEQSKTLQDDIHDVAVEIMLHTHKHGDYTKAQVLVDGLGKGIRAKGLVAWFEKCGLNVDAQKGFSGYNRKIHERNWDFCKANRWYTMKPDNPFAGFDLDAEIARLLKKAEKAIKLNSETPEEEKGEDFKFTCDVSKLTALRQLAAPAGVTIQ